MGRQSESTRSAVIGARLRPAMPRMASGQVAHGVLQTKEGQRARERVGNPDRQHPVWMPLGKPDVQAARIARLMAREARRHRAMVLDCGVGMSLVDDGLITHDGHPVFRAPRSPGLTTTIRFERKTNVRTRLVLQSRSHHVVFVAGEAGRVCRYSGPRPWVSGVPSSWPASHATISRRNGRPFTRSMSSGRSRKTR